VPAPAVDGNAEERLEPFAGVVVVVLPEAGVRSDLLVHPAVGGVGHVEEVGRVPAMRREPHETSRSQ